MRFHFKEKASTLYDFFMFPKLLYIEPEETHKLNDVLGDEISKTFLDHDAYKAFIKAAREDLEPYKDPLLGFYADEVISNYDFPSLLFRSYSLLGYETHQDYLQAIKADDDAVIKKNLIYALIKVESGDDEISDEEARASAESLCDDSDALLKLIRQTPTTENHRWILMMIIENPKSYLNVYIDLMNTLKPVFERHYRNYEKKIEHFKQDIVETLQKGGVEAFEALTHNIIPREILKDENDIITSVVNPYRFGGLTFGEDAVIVWGLEMKTGFKNIADFSQDTRKNRAKVFKTLSDETRYEVLKHIANGVRSTKTIATSLGISSATVIYHINAFITAKLIKVVKTNDKPGYLVDYEGLETFWRDFINDLKSK